MARSRCIVFSLSLLAASLPAYSATLTVTNLGDSGTGVCSLACTLRDAINSAAPGDTVAFSNTFSYPATITLNGQQLLVYKSLTINGPGAQRLSISGNANSRLFEIAANSTVAIDALMLTDGKVLGADGVAGQGQSGGPAYGGAVYVDDGSTLQLSACVIANNTVHGGTSSSAPFGFPTIGGTAYGAAIYSAGTLIVNSCSLVSNSAIGGSGGPGVVGGFFGSTGGSGGLATGGAIYATGLFEATNSQFLLNIATGGMGGSSPLATTPPSTGGGGGLAQGGALATTGFTTLSFVSAVGNAANFGPPGTGDTNGPPGSAQGSDIYATSNVLSRYAALTSTTAGPTPPGTPIATCAIASSSTQGSNLDADSSCGGFNLHGAANLQILTSGGQTFAFPLWGSPLIDVAADCKDAFGTTLTVDVRGGVRPLEGNDAGVIPTCDIGAVESDELFANGFE